MASSADLTTRLIEALLKEAASLMADGRTRSALSRCYRALLLRPGDHRCLRLAGDVHAAAGDEESALRCHRGAMPEADEARYLDAPLHAARARSLQSPGDVRTRPAHDAERVPLTPPNGLHRADALPQFRYESTDARASFVTEIEGGEVWFDGFNTLVMDRGRRIVGPSSKGNAALARAAALPCEPLALAGTACFLDARSAPIYYHWMLDVLPKLEVLESAGIALDDIDHFVVRADAAFCRETLRRCGIDPERVVTPPDGMHVSADRLLVPWLKNALGARVNRGLGLGLASWIPAWLRARFVTAATTAEPAGERLYISRAKRGTRGVLAEDELVSALAERGFRTVCPEEHPVAEQAAMFDRASVVVGVHGAGLTNTAFCRPGTLVVEIFGDYVVPCYWALAALAGLDYAHYLSEDAGDRDGASGRDQAARRADGVQLDPQHFSAWLDERLASRRGSARS